MRKGKKNRWSLHCSHHKRWLLSQYCCCIRHMLYRIWQWEVRATHVTGCIHSHWWIALGTRPDKHNFPRDDDNVLQKGRHKNLCTFFFFAISLLSSKRQKFFSHNFHAWGTIKAGLEDKGIQFFFLSSFNLCRLMVAKNLHLWLQAA